MQTNEFGKSKMHSTLSTRFETYKDVLNFYLAIGLRKLFFSKNNLLFLINFANEETILWNNLTHTLIFPKNCLCEIR